MSSETITNIIFGLYALVTGIITIWQSWRIWYAIRPGKAQKDQFCPCFEGSLQTHPFGEKGRLTLAERTRGSQDIELASPALPLRVSTVVIAFDEERGSGETDERGLQPSSS